MKWGRLYLWVYVYWCKIPVIQCLFIKVACYQRAGSALICTSSGSLSCCMFDALAAARPFLSLPASQHRYSILTLFLTFILFCPTMESIITATPDQPSFSSQIFSRPHHLRTSSEVYTAFKDKCQQFRNPSGIQTGCGADSFEEVFEIAQATNYNEAMKSIKKSKSGLGDGKKWFLDGCDF